MAETVEIQNQSLSSRQRHGRAINAVAELLRRKLAVPHIFLKPPAKLLHTDVLAIDRAGSGDLHAVEIKLPADTEAPNPATDNTTDRESPKQFRLQVMRAFEQLRSDPTHFKYLAIPANRISLLENIDLFARDGIGKFGVIAIKESGEGPPGAEIVIAPERFRVEAQKMVAIEKFLVKAKPDIEVRI